MDFRLRLAYLNLWLDPERNQAQTRWHQAMDMRRFRLCWFRSWAVLFTTSSIFCVLLWIKELQPIPIIVGFYLALSMLLNKAAATLALSGLAVCLNRLTRRKWFLWPAPVEGKKVMTPSMKINTATRKTRVKIYLAFQICEGNSGYLLVHSYPYFDILVWKHFDILVFYPTLLVITLTSNLEDDLLWRFFLARVTLIQ